MLSNQYDHEDSFNSSQRYICRLLIMPNEEGGYSAVPLNLPGVGSCGDTEAEAIEGAREAIIGVIQSYRDRGLEVPWIDATNQLSEHQYEGLSPGKRVVIINIAQQVATDQHWTCKAGSAKDTKHWMADDFDAPLM